jgi:hypothetical protein
MKKLIVNTIVFFIMLYHYLIINIKIIYYMFLGYDEQRIIEVLKEGYK